MNIKFPDSYVWLKEKEKIVGFCEFSQLQPWYYLHENACFLANEKWPGVTKDRLFVFTKRQDNDELACFKLNIHNEAIEVLLINGWTSEGFEYIEEWIALN